MLCIHAVYPSRSFAGATVVWAAKTCELTPTKLSLAGIVPFLAPTNLGLVGGGTLMLLGGEGLANMDAPQMQSGMQPRMQDGWQRLGRATSE